MRRIRVAQMADSHVDEHSPRWDDGLAVHAQVVDLVREREVDILAHAGDMYERKSTPRERDAAANFVQGVTEYARMVLVRGNHDVEGDLSILGRLDTRNPIHVIESVDVLHLETRGGPITVAGLAWPRKAELLARLPASTSVETSSAVAAECLRDVLRGIGLHGGPGKPPLLLVAHAMVRGSVTSHGQPLVGCDMEIDLTDLSLANATQILLGHIHKGQAWSFNGIEIVYPGSPRRTAFGELEDKHLVIVDFIDEGYGWVARSAERVVLTTTPMILVEAAWRPAVDGHWRFEMDLPPELVGGGDTEPRGGGAAIDWDNPLWRGAEVRFRYSVDADRRDAAKVDAKRLAELLVDRSGAKRVKDEEELNTTSRARAPEVAAAVTLPEKLRALWAARRENIEPERAEELCSLALELERELAEEAA